MAALSFEGVQSGDHLLVVTPDSTGAIQAAAVDDSPGVEGSWRSWGLHRVTVFAEYTQAAASKTLTVKLQVSADGSNWEDFSSNSFTISSGSGGTARSYAAFTPPPAPYYRVLATQDDSTSGGTVKLRAQLTRL